MTQTSQFLINHGLPLMFAAVFVEQRGLPLPALPWLLAAGALSAAGQFNFPLGVAVTVFACLVADAFWFYLGRHRGNQILGLLCRISLEPDSCVRRTQNVFTRYGLRGLLAAKFLPGLSTVALSLHRRGFARVRPLLGGIDAWREQHYPMEPRPSDGAAPVATSPLAREGVVANVASIPLPGGNESHPAKGGNGKVSILLVATSLVWIAGCKPKAHVTPSPPMVEVFTVTQADVPLYHEWIGVLDGLVNAQIRAQVTGYLITQDYDEGDPIKKDDLLFQIDPRPFKAAFDQAQGLLAQAEARSGKTELDVKRYAPLVKDRAISQEEYDDAVQADLEAKAAVVSAKAQVEQAQLNLGFTRITSPIDGIASIAKAQIGDLVGPATGELTTVSTIDPIKVYYRVTEQAYINFAKRFSTETDRIKQLKKLEIELVLTDGSVYPLKGQNYAAGRQIGSTTGALRVEALFPNPGNALRPGEFARVRVKFDLKHDALLVPQRAVSELQGSHQVAVVEADNKVHIQPVRVGDRSGNLWIIEVGLHPGQRVVVEGLQKVREGVTVTSTNFVVEPLMQSAAAQLTK